jgi:hypothetical protein
LPERVLNRPKAPLASDPLEIMLRKGNDWRSNLSLETPASLERYVLTAKWRETLETSQGSIHVEDLRPLTLGLWLKDIENTRLIQ